MQIIWNEKKQIINIISYKMKGREVFFKPYRERIHEMYQQHDSIEPGDQFEQERDKNRNYSPFFNNMNRSYTPTNANNPPRYQDSYKYYDKSKEKKKNKSYVQAKMEKEMHQPIWEHLYAQGLQAQNNLMEAHELKKNKIDTQCTFEPNIKKNNRYVIPSSSNFLERNYIWQENKIDRIVKEKEEEVVKGLEDCTFRPKINSYYKLKSNKYSYKNFVAPNHAANAVQSQTVANSRAIQTSKSATKLSLSATPVKKKTPYIKDSDGMNRQEVGKIKNLIRNELKRIQL